VQCYFQLLLDKYNRFILFTGTSSGRGGNDGASFFFFPRVTKAYEVDIGAARKGRRKDVLCFLSRFVPSAFLSLLLSYIHFASSYIVERWEPEERDRKKETCRLVQSSSL